MAGISWHALSHHWLSCRTCAMSGPWIFLAQVSESALVCSLTDFHSRCETFVPISYFLQQSHSPFSLLQNYKFVGFDFWRLETFEIFWIFWIKLKAPSRLIVNLSISLRLRCLVALLWHCRWRWWILGGGQNFGVRSGWSGIWSLQHLPVFWLSLIAYKYIYISHIS